MSCSLLLLGLVELVESSGRLHGTPQQLQAFHWPSLAPYHPSHPHTPSIWTHWTYPHVGTVCRGLQGQRLAGLVPERERVKRYYEHVFTESELALGVSDTMGWGVEDLVSRGPSPP